jgi:hypothetical protein
VRQQSADLPRRTCDQLIQDGPGPHRYLALTDACLSGGSSVAERDGESGHLEMYHPLYPAHRQPEPAAGELRLLLCIKDELARRRIRDDRGPRFQLGELIGEVSKADLPGWARARLDAQYPGLRLDQCWLIKVGEHEPTPARADRLQWYGLVTLPVAMVIGIGWWMWTAAAKRR